MAVGLTTTTQVAPGDRTFYNKRLLSRAIPFLAHHMFGQQSAIPKHSGDQPKWRRYSALPQAIAPLVEGVTPNAQQLSVTDVTGQLVQYGAYVRISDYALDVNQDKTLTEAAELLGENGGESLDTIYRDTLIAGTSVFYAGAVTGRAAVVTAATAADLNKVIRALRSANAKYWRTNPIPGKDAVGTYPVAPAYMAITDPYVTYDLKDVTGFKQPFEYSDPKMALPGEVGSFQQIRFIESTNAKVYATSGGSATALYGTVSTTSVDVFITLVFGQDAYGITPLAGRTMEYIFKPVGSGEDALNQRATAGWKATTDIKILNESFMYRYESGASK